MERFSGQIFTGREGRLFGVSDVHVPVGLPVRRMVECSYETRSHSFYFADDRLVMHNEADFAYNGGQ